MNEKNKYYVKETNDYILDMENCEEHLMKNLLFFEYKTHSSSKQCYTIDSKFYVDIFEEMINVWKGNSNLNEHYIFNSNNKNEKDKKFDLYGLLSDEINLKYKKMVLLSDSRKDSKDNKDNNYDFLTFTRHLRNSIAHGSVYVNNTNKRNTIMFVDYNSNGNLTSKIICVPTDLLKWKNIITRYAKLSKSIKK